MGSIHKIALWLKMFLTGLWTNCVSSAINVWGSWCPCLHCLVYLICVLIVGKSYYSFFVMVWPPYYYRFWTCCCCCYTCATAAPVQQHHHAHVPLLCRTAATTAGHTSQQHNYQIIAFRRPHYTSDWSCRSCLLKQSRGSFILGK